MLFSQSRLPLVVSCEATRALRFLFRRGNLVESESLELELGSARSPHVLGE